MLIFSFHVFIIHIVSFIHVRVYCCITQLGWLSQLSAFAMCFSSARVWRPWGFGEASSLHQKAGYKSITSDKVAGGREDWCGRLLCAHTARDTSVTYVEGHTKAHWRTSSTLNEFSKFRGDWCQARIRLTHSTSMAYRISR